MERSAPLEADTWTRFKQDVKNGHVVYSDEARERAALESLTILEREIVKMFLGGMRWLDIGKQINQRKQNIYDYKSRIFRKLSVNNGVELVLFAVRHYLINPWPSDYTHDVS